MVVILLVSGAVLAPDNLRGRGLLAAAALTAASLAAGMMLAGMPAGRPSRYFVLRVMISSCPSVWWAVRTWRGNPGSAARRRESTARSRSGTPSLAARRTGGRAPCSGKSYCRSWVVSLLFAGDQFAVMAQTRLRVNRRRPTTVTLLKW